MAPAPSSPGTGGPAPAVVPSTDLRRVACPGYPGAPTPPWRRGRRPNPVVERTSLRWLVAGTRAGSSVLRPTHPRPHLHPSPRPLRRIPRIPALTGRGLRAGPWAPFKRRWRAFAGSVLNGLPGRLPTAAPHGRDECTAPQREPGIPEVCVPGKSMLVGIVCSVDHTGLDEPASDAEHAAVDGEPDSGRPSQRPSSPRPGPRREVTDADEDERRDGANQFQHDYHPQGDDDTCRALPAPPLDVATDSVEQCLASERPIRAHCCARCPEAGSNHRREESTPIGSFHTASLSRISGQTSWSGCVYPAALRSPSTTHLGLRAPTCRSLRARERRPASGRRGDTRHRLCIDSCTSLGVPAEALSSPWRAPIARCGRPLPASSAILNAGPRDRQIWASP
jgi:hypothetical protein